MRAIVFGGCGNVGSYVAADLCDLGFEVSVFDQGKPAGILRGYDRKFRWFEGDIADATQVEAAVRESKADRIVHVAAMLAFGIVGDPRRGMQINVDGTVNVLEAAKACGVERVVFASTDSVCGDEGLARVEVAPMGPTMSVYAATKYLGERLGCLYADRHGFRFIALRYSLTFGPGVIRSPGTARAFQDLQGSMNGSPVTISDFSGDWRQQITYVRDTAAATVLALTHQNPSFQIYNVAGPYENFVSMAEFHSVLRSVVPQTGPATFTGPKRAGGVCDITRIQSDLGFRPRYSIAEGIKARIADMQQWGS